MKTRKILPVLAVLMFVAESAVAANYFVRAGASGNGTDWANAFGSLPATLVRGSIYYVADGSYGSYTCDDAVSGTSIITIRKATIADHGTNTGWSDSYGDGQASFGEFVLASDYWVIDGRTRDESNWADGAKYGFRASGVTANTSISPGVCASNIAVKYVNVGGAEGTSYTGSEPGTAIYVGGFDELCANWDISTSYVHNVAHYTLIQFAGMNGCTVERNLFANAWGKEAIRGQIALKNCTIRNNRFHNACGNGGGVGEGCTAEIAIWDGNTSGFDANKIYGNTFYRTRDENSGGTIVVGGNGSSWAGPSASNTLVYNNTIAGISGSVNTGGNILVNGGSGNICRNNLAYSVAGSFSVNCNTASNNSEVTADPFVGFATGNLHPKAATPAGYALTSPFDVDLDGNTRGADGTWDIGAYEYASGAPDTVLPTVSITAPASGASVSGATLVTATASDNVGVAGVQFMLDGVNLDPEDTATPYSITWNTATASNGTHALTARARDAAGNGKTSAVVTVTVVSDSTPPTITLTAPASGSSISGSTVITASASDNVGVAGVQFMVDGVDVGPEDTASPYSMSWDTTTVPNGAHALTATARDASGNAATSLSATTTVSNAVAVPTSGPVASYNFNENVGSVLNDRSGNAHTGTISGATWSSGKYGAAALSFNGISNLVNLGSVLSAGAAQLTIEAWVNKRDNADSRIVCKATGINLADHVFCLGAAESGSANVARVRLTTSSGSSSFDSTTTFPVNVWTHVAFTFDGSSVRIYLNGALAGSFAKTGGIVQSAQAMVIGNVNLADARYFNGLIDDLRIYSKALTQSEIQADMNTSIAPANPTGMAVH